MPIIGEEAALAAGLTTLARVISTAGNLANDALVLYGEAKDPAQGIIGILGMLGAIGAKLESVDGRFVGLLSEIYDAIPVGAFSSLGSTFMGSEAMLVDILGTIKMS